MVGFGSLGIVTKDGFQCEEEVQQLGPLWPPERSVDSVIQMAFRAGITDQTGDRKLVQSCRTL